MRVSVEVDVRWPAKLHSRRRRAFAALVLGTALVVPGVAFASHQFTDVPTDHTFHGDIADLYKARITAGCSPTTFCPGEPVTRGQMAGFLNRGLPRLSHGSLSGSSSGAAANIGAVTIKAGNPTGGYQYVVVIATVNAYVNLAGCPCEATVGLYNGVSQISPLMYIDLVATPANDGDTDGGATVIGIAIVQTGVDYTYHVNLKRETGTGNVHAYGTIIATVYPFDGQGAAPLHAEALGGGLPDLPGKARR